MQTLNQAVVSMKMKLIGIFALILAAPLTSQAKNADLAQVYQNALQNDPTFKKAYSDWLTQKENLPLAMTGSGAAGTGLFPNLTFSATFNKNYITPQNKKMQQYSAQNYQLTLTQPLFNLQTWENIGVANYTVKAATASYMAATQDLISRTISSYFEVLRAKAALASTLTEKKMVHKELTQAKEKNKVGIIALTDVYDAQAKYDQIRATEIKNRNTIQNNLEDLTSITGVQYSNVEDLKKSIPMNTLKDKSINAWVATALQQNYSLQAQLNTMMAAKKSITVAETAKIPSINLVSSYSNVTNPVTSNENINGTTTQQNATVGLNLNFPIFRGGYDFANTKQKRYEYLSSSNQVQITKNTVVKNTRQAFLSVDSGANQIQADLQALKAAQAKLKATKNSYIAGIQTMVDVLDAVGNLAEVQLNYANDRYNYVESIANLKHATGTLSPADITEINSWINSKT